MRRSFVHDEELGTCGVRIHSPRHGQNAFRVSQVVGQETILSEFARDGVARAADSGTLRVAALDHKAADHAVEDQTVIESFLNEAYKIVDGIRSDLRIQFCFDHIAVLHGKCNNWICHNHSSPLFRDKKAVLPPKRRNTALPAILIISVFQRQGKRNFCSSPAG